MHQFSFLPYFPSTDFDMRVGRLHLLSFWKYKDAYIPDQTLREKLERICQLYVDTKLETLDELTIAVIDGNYSLTPPTDEQRRDIQRYADALNFCSVILNETNRAYTSDNFLLLHQNFTLTEDAIVYTTGSYVRLQNWQPFETAKLIKPSYIQDSIFRYRFDETLLQAFASTIDAHNNDDDYLFMVLEWFRYAYMNVEGFSYPNRVVLLATAYEVFFQLPDFGKTDAFATRLEALLKVDQMNVHDKQHRIIQTGLPIIRKANALGKVKENTIYGWWARAFYDLRSKIVHGSEVVKGDLLNHNDVEHFQIGVKMLQFCFYRLLEDKGHLIYRQSSPEVQAAFPNVNFDKLFKENDLRDIEELIK